jgi:hypothetical protein
MLVQLWKTRRTKMITGFYAGLLGLIFVALSISVIIKRNQAKISLGEGENTDLIKRIRMHGNFAEYVPFILVLMGFMEFVAVSPMLLHILGAATVLSRLLHIYALSDPHKRIPMRAAAMVVTFSVILFSSFYLVARFTL